MEKATADFYERVAKSRDPKLAANWVIVEFFGALNRSGKSIEDSPVTAEGLGELIDLIADNTVSGRLAKDVFALMRRERHSAMSASSPAIGLAETPMAVHCAARRTAA